jgi:pantetheine-phosphate adenylyltransferase
MVKTAIYPGSFDPITNGHLDVISRAAKLFDRVIVAVAHNPEKAPLFSTEERAAMVREAVRKLPAARKLVVDDFRGLLIHYVRRRKAHVLIRGLRAVSDFEFEFQLALMNRKLDGSVETIFMMPKDEYTFLSSRLVREIAALGGDVRPFVPRNVERVLKEKFRRQ